MRTHHRDLVLTRVELNMIWDAINAHRHKPTDWRPWPELLDKISYAINAEDGWFETELPARKPRRRKLIDEGDSLSPFR